MGEAEQALLVRAPLPDVAYDRPEGGALLLVPARQRQFDRELRPVPVPRGQLDGLAEELKFTPGGDPVQATIVAHPHTLWNDEIDRLTNRFGGAMAEQPFRGVVPERDFAPGVGADDAIRRGGCDLDEAHAACLLGDLEPAQFQPVEREIGQIPQDRLICRAEAVARARIGETQSADGVAGRRAQRNPGVEANVGWSDNQWIVVEARVERGVEDDQSVVMRNRMGTERNLSVGLAQVEADLGVEHLTVAIDERNKGGRHIEQVPGQGDDLHECRRWRLVDEIILGQCCEAVVF